MQNNGQAVSPSPLQRVTGMIKRMDEIDDLDVQALVDNQNLLTAEENIRIRQAIERNPALRLRYEELQQQKFLLQQWWEENKKETLQ